MNSFDRIIALEDQVSMLTAERYDLQRQVDGWKAKYKKDFGIDTLDHVVTSDICMDQEDMITRLTPALKDEHRHSVVCSHGPECEVCQLIVEAENWLAEPLFSEE